MFIVCDSSTQNLFLQMRNQLFEVSRIFWRSSLHVTLLVRNFKMWENGVPKMASQPQWLQRELGPAGRHPKSTEIFCIQSLKQCVDAAEDSKKNSINEIRWEADKKAYPMLKGSCG